MDRLVVKPNLKLCLAVICLLNLAPSAYLPSVNLVRCDMEVTISPPFPQLTNWAKKKLHITSESVDERLGVETIDEMHDIDSEKSVYYLQKVSTNGQQSAPYLVKYLDGPDNLCYTYQPYWCKVSRISELDDSLFDPATNAWNYNVKIKQRQDREFRAMGVYGLWLFASMTERTFSKGKLIYSSSQEDWTDSLVWTVRDETNKLTIKLYYSDNLGQKSQESSAPGIMIDPRAGPQLEMIQIWTDESDGKSRLIRTINILSIDDTVSDDELADHFSPPVGFGCFTELPGDVKYEEALAQRKLASNVLRESMHGSTHFELEITGTKYGDTGDLNEARLSETYNVEMALALIPGSTVSKYVELTRHRSTDKDEKRIVNHMLQVVYTIDMRKGTCETSSLKPKQDDNKVVGTADEADSNLNLRFEKLGRDLDVSYRLLAMANDVHFVKRTPASHGIPEIVYFEGGAAGGVPKDLISARYGQNRQARMIWTCVVTPSGSYELKSMTIWVLDDKNNRLLESYQINIISRRLLESSWPDKAKLFDISEECYLENEHMKQNRDYAWLQFTYPASSRVLPVLARNEILLKSMFYSKVVDDFTRVPRIEVMFEDDSFVVRVLMLDLPETELVYDKTEGQRFVPIGELGDLTYMAADGKHCGHMCRLHQCTVMTYCSMSHECLLSTRPLREHSETSKLPESPERTFEYRIVTACNTYKMPVQVERNRLLKSGRLHSTIARYQHQNYGTATLPKQPDEILLPTSETGLSPAAFVSNIIGYKEKLDEFMSNDGRSPELLIYTIVENHPYFFLPNKFYLENDPMHHLNIYQDDDDDDDEDDDEDNNGGSGSMMDSDQKVPRYHQGLSMSRYLVSAPAVDGHKIAFRTYTGISYHQCALACTDSKCGSFSYCYNNERECILSSVNSTGRATSLNLVERNSDCFIMQRDFLANFIKYENIYRPQVYTKVSEGGDASDCALDCVAETSFKCLSFEFCPGKVSTTAGKPADAGSAKGECYFQSERHLPGMWQKGANGKSSKSSSNPSNAIEPAAKADVNCDHYSRAYLADFVRLEARRVVPAVMDKLKTSTFDGLSVFSCAEKCANELLDCTAFQFCSSIATTSSREARECVTIESKVTPKILRLASGQTSSGQDNEGETIVDEQDEGTVLSDKAKYLEHHEDCQLFTMRSDSSEAHLRDLAFGGLIKTAREKKAEDSNAKNSDSSGGLSFVGGLFLYISVALVSATIGCGLIILKDRNEYVRQKYERLRIFLRI